MAEAIQVPDVTELDCAFPSRYRALLPKWEDLTDDEKRGRGPFCEVVSQLFFCGGRLSDHGIVVKSGVDERKVYRYLAATLGDWGPSHEHKIGGIAHMLAQWCEIKSPPPQKEAKKGKRRR